MLNSKPAEQGNEEEVVTSPFPTGYRGCQSQQMLVPLEAALQPMLDYLGEYLISAFPQLGKRKRGDLNL